MYSEFANRIGRTDLLGSLPAGLMIVTATLVVAKGLQPNYVTLSLINENAGIFALFATVASLVAGTLARSIRVNTPDNWCATTFHTFKKADADKLRFTNDDDAQAALNEIRRFEFPEAILQQGFPYSALLLSNLENLKQHCTVTNTSAEHLADDKKMCVFDFWKGTLTYSAPQISEYLQTLEARVRFVAGMIWASAFGCVAGILTCCLTVFTRQDPAGQGVVGWPNEVVSGIREPTLLSGAIFVFVASLVFSWFLHGRHGKTKEFVWSTLLAVLAAATILAKGAYPLTFFLCSSACLIGFGSRLRRVRFEEASETFMAYVYHRETQVPAPKTPPTKALFNFGLNINSQ